MKLVHFYLGAILIVTGEVEAVDERAAQLKEGVGRINRGLSFYPDVKVALTSVWPFTIYSAPLSFCVTPATRQFYTHSTMNLSNFGLKDLVNLLIMTNVIKCKIDI